MAAETEVGVGCDESDGGGHLQRVDGLPEPYGSLALCRAGLFFNPGLYLARCLLDPDDVEWVDPGTDANLLWDFGGN